MLNIPTPFPQVGAPAFLRPDAPATDPAPVRILRRNADGTVLISHGAVQSGASGNATVPLADLTATREEAFPPLKPKRRARRSASATA